MGAVNERGNEGGDCRVCGANEADALRDVALRPSSRGAKGGWAKETESASTTWICHPLG